MGTEMKEDEPELCGSKLILTGGGPCAGARCGKPLKLYDCARCKGSGKVCLKCDGSGTYSCATCHKHKVEVESRHGKNCPACSGAGFWISQGIESRGKRYCSVNCIPRYEKLKEPASNQPSSRSQHLTNEKVKKPAEKTSSAIALW